MKKLICPIVTLFVTLFILISSSPSYGAQAGLFSNASGGPRRQLVTIILSGLGGSILGLSTLSFYDRPQDHLENIAVGFGLGVIIGATFVTYTTANSPFYDAIPKDNENRMLASNPKKLTPSTETHGLTRFDFTEARKGIPLRFNWAWTF